MTQYCAHANLEADSRRFPYVLDIQSPLLGEMKTRVVVPLVPAAAIQGAALHRLNPALNIHGATYVMLTQQMATLPISSMGREAIDCSAYRFEIVAALDCLISGV